MQPWTLAAALLCLSCCLPLSVGDVQYVDIESYKSVGTVDFKGSKLRVFEVDGARAHVAEPRVAFDNYSCNYPKFSRLFMKYQLVLPIRIDANTLQAPLNTSTRVGHVTITGLSVKANKGLSDGESGLIAMVDWKASSKADLVFMCSSVLRCLYLGEYIWSNSSDLRRALKFEAVGRVGDRLVRFGAISSANSPSGPRCWDVSHDGWVVFQRRVDGSLSFAQNWDTYVKGFGNPETNYWMGLGLLAEMTHSSGDITTARCGLKIELEDKSGMKYSVEYKMFKVFGPEQNYRWQFGGVVARSGFSDAAFGRLESDSNKSFSTFDRDNDECDGSCSQREGGNGGWWYESGCGYFFLNAIYPPNSSVTHPTYAIFHNGSQWAPIRRSAMKVRCR